MKQQTRGSKPYFTMALFALLVLATLALVLVGSRVYEALVQGQGANAQGRAVRAYVYAQLRGADRTDGIAQGQGPEGQALLLREEVDGTVYETRIYLYQGQLMEEYSTEEMPISPERAKAVAKAVTFSVKQMQDDLLKIDTDAGAVYVAFRSVGGVVA